VRAELCQEAMRLAAPLLQHPLAATPATYALSALMCLDAARLPARVDGSGNLTSLFEQDRSLWDRQLIAEGMKLLELSATGSELSEYHLEAAIASVHVTAQRVEDTDWAQIVSLYDQLMVIRPSSVIALNRAIAIAQHEGAQRGLDEIRAISDSERLANYPFYHAALGEFELREGNRSAAKDHFKVALHLARNPMERRFLNQRVNACEQGDALA
jgi:predicted RNA polymerase sigma factor